MVKTVLPSELSQKWVVFAKIDNITFTSSIQQISNIPYYYTDSIILTSEQQRPTNLKNDLQ